MKISESTERKLVWGSVLGTVAGFVGMFYSSQPTPEKIYMKELEGRVDFLGQKILQCTPREKGTFSSDECIDYAGQYDSTRIRIDSLQNNPVYISARQKYDYSLYLGLFGGASMFLNAFISEKRKNKNNGSKGE